MTPWDSRFLCHPYFINKTLQQVIDDENNNKDRQTQSFSRKVPEESVEAIEIISSSLKHFFYDPMKIFPKPMGTINNRIM